MAGKTKKVKKSSSGTARSVMGQLLPPVDVTSTSMLGELDKRIKAGPITLVLIYADWCGHCQRFKPMMEDLEKCPGRSVQTARIRDDVLPQSSLATIPKEGYPSLVLINKDGTPVQFKNQEGEITNVIPDHTDMLKMKTLVRNAGTPEGLTIVNGTEPANTIQTMSAPSASNYNTTALTAPLAPSAPSSTQVPRNIIADRLSAENIARLNQTLLNSKNTLLKEATKPVSQQGGMFGGGGLWGSLLSASQELAPAAALFLASSATRKSARKPSRKATRKATRKNRRRV